MKAQTLKLGIIDHHARRRRGNGFYLRKSHSRRQKSLCGTAHFECGIGIGCGGTDADIAAVIHDDALRAVGGEADFVFVCVFFDFYFGVGVGILDFILRAACCARPSRAARTVGGQDLAVGGCARADFDIGHGIWSDGWRRIGTL
jgi:hypothetical protein